MKKSLFKRAAAALLSVSMLSVFSACGDKAAPGPSSAGTTGGTAGAGAGELKKLVIAEPVHMIGYLPLYIAQSEGYFAEEGLDIEVVQASGGAHVTAVISGDAWGNIGGPESNAYADAGGNSPEPLVSFCNCVNRANVYLSAVAGTSPSGTSDAELSAFLKGKRIIAGRFGGTPNLLVRYLLISLGLDPDKDVTMVEPSDTSTILALVKQGQADIANPTEPMITQGISDGTWDEPFYKFHDLGDFAYSVLSTRKSTIEKDPETVQAFTNAIVKALKAVAEDPEFAFQCAKKEFPTMSDEDLKVSLDRAYEDKYWSPDGFITPEALDRDMDVIIKAGVFSGTYTYDDMIDMTFVEKANG